MTSTLPSTGTSAQRTTGRPNASEIAVAAAIALLSGGIAAADAVQVDLPDLGAGGCAIAASRDGSVIVGWVAHPFSPWPKQACRWVNGALQLLPAPLSETWQGSFPDSKAYGVSADGRTACGTYNSQKI